MVSIGSVADTGPSRPISSLRKFATLVPSLGLAWQVGGLSFLVLWVPWSVLRGAHSVLKVF